MPPKCRIPDGVRTVRKDLSTWLWHFVRRDVNQAETVRAILDGKRLKAMQADHVSKAWVLCFTEAPLSECVRQDRVLADSAYTLFSLFGVGFRRRWLWAKGALPVIYQPNTRLDELPEKQKWRHVEFDLSKPNPVDFTWQREWRLNKVELEFSEKDVVLVIPDTDELKDHLWEYQVDPQVEEGQVVLYGAYLKRWNFIPLAYEKIESDANIEVCLAKDHTDIIPEEHNDVYDEL